LSGLILKQIPDFVVDDIYSENKISKKSLLGHKTNKIFVHFWATWCAPCESEIKEFLSFANKNSDSIFLLIAINDDVKKVKKFLGNFATTNSSSVLFGIDQTGRSNQDFGTVKVPETYLFNSNGVAIKKFIGAQLWK